MIKIKTLFLEEILNENFRVRKKINLINNLDSTIFFKLFGVDSSKIFDQGWKNPLPDIKILKGLYHTSSANRLGKKYLIKVEAAFLFKRTQQSFKIRNKSQKII